MAMDAGRWDDRSDISSRARRIWLLKREEKKKKRHGTE